jgi:hypothetical protein
MYVVFSVQRAPVLKKSLWNDSQNSAVLMLNAQNGCKKLSVSSDSKKEGKQEPIWEVSSASVGVEIPSCVWFTNRNGLPYKSHMSLVSTIGHGNADCAMEP